jgi:hypothetical protein
MIRLPLRVDDVEGIPRVLPAAGQPFGGALRQHEVGLALDCHGEDRIDGLVGEDDAAQAPHVLVQ